MKTTALALAGILLLGAGVAGAQDAPSPTQDTGPLVLVPIASAIVFSPDVKVTSINNDTATLAGVYVGKLAEKRVLVGAGAYWLANPRSDARLFYAGLVLGGRILGTDRANLNARTLVGIGHATLYEAVQFAEGPRKDRHFGFDGREFRIGLTDDFWMVDPEIRLAIMINRLISLDVGAGYRLTAGRGGFNDAFDGATGSIGIRFNVE